MKSNSIVEIWRQGSKVETFSVNEHISLFEYQKNDLHDIFIA